MIVPTVPTVGLGSTVIVLQFGALDPQALLSDTQTDPEETPNVTVIVLVPCPTVMLAPDGMVQL